MIYTAAFTEYDSECFLKKYNANAEVLEYQNQRENSGKKKKNNTKQITKNKQKNPHKDK